jgi:outer membrane protein
MILAAFGKDCCVMKSTSIALLAALLSSTGIAFAQSDDSLSLAAAVRLAIDNSFALRQAGAQARAADARITQSESDYLPRVSVSADYTRIGPIPAFGFPGIGTIPLAPENNYAARLSATQTLLDLGLRSAKVESNLRTYRVVEDAERTIRSGLELQVTQDFYTVILLERSVAVQDRQLAALHEHLRITRKRVESGSATDFDVLTTSVRVAQAENVRIDLLHSLNDQKIALRKLLGLRWDAAADVRGTFDESYGEEALDSLLAGAERDRPDLITARHSLDVAGAQESVARRENDPILRLHAAYGFNNGYEPNLNAIRGNWSAGVQLEVPLFDGHRTEGKAEEATAMREAAEERYRDLRRSAESEIRQAVQAVGSARAKVESTSIQVQQAEAAVANARVRYESGAGTNLDLLDAETNVATARLQQLQAHYQLTMAVAGLNASTGMYGR